MGMFTTWLGRDEDRDDMARSKAQPIDAEKVELLTQQLRAAVADAKAFEGLYKGIADNKSLSGAEVVAIAKKFAGGSPKNRKAAITAIAQERLRLAHSKAKAQSAKTRVW